MVPQAKPKAAELAASGLPEKGEEFAGISGLGVPFAVQ